MLVECLNMLYNVSYCMLPDFGCMSYVKIYVFFDVAHFILECGVVCCCMLYVRARCVCWNVYCAVMCGDADTDSGAGPRHRQGPR